MKIHGHPQKSVYGSPAEWPQPSFQGHYNVGTDDPTESSHVHIEPKFPLYAEMDSTDLEVPFTVQLHHFHGRLGGLYGENIKEIIWDGEKPPLIGDPNGDKLWTGRAIVNIGQAQDERFARHEPGWGIMRFGSRSYFGDVPDEGNKIDVCGWVPFYSIIGQGSVPEKPSEPSGARGILSSRVDLYSPLSKNQIGSMILEYQDFLPLAPITAPWSTIGTGYNYTTEVPFQPDGSRLPNGFFELRQDVDFHHGNRGLIEFSNQADVAGVAKTVVFDPMVMGNGVHKEALIWRQTFNTEHLWSLITFPVSVTDVNAPPMPTTCNDPLALNVGQIGQCVYSPVDPLPPDFQIISPTFKRVSGTNRVQIFDGSTLLGELAYKP